MTQEEIEELAKAMVKLIKTDPRVYGAIWDSACDCPNLVAQY